MKTATKCAHPSKTVVVTYETPVKEFKRCDLCGATHQRQKRTGEVTPWKKARKGTCFLCGCTEAHACAGGCSWANEAQTLCSACVL